jgi:hypothetical protein
MVRLIPPRLSNLTLGLALLLTPSSLHAWAREGHEIIAIIAEQRLTPEVRDAALTLLEGTTFVEVASWADKVRNQQTAPWHYVNIEIGETKYDPDRVCPKNQCVIGQIERFRRVLANEEAEFKKRQKALKYLIHFVGDLHQPLHSGQNNDHGGNDVQVEFLGQTINPYNHNPWNLHAVWDSGILQKRDKDPQSYADRLNGWLNSQPEGAFRDGSVIDWAMESHDIAKDHVYVLPEDRKLEENYYRANEAVVDQQLAKAGVRLAKLLNDALGKRK